ncbi:MAG TPA: alpha/beta fold hydrolase [Thermotogaceae bacterium]|nr:alpha/beta fold hydrolase [Thermotogaceae bacterium]
MCLQWNRFIVLILLLSLFFPSLTDISFSSSIQVAKFKQAHLMGSGKETYIVPTRDNSSITLTRYKGDMRSIIFIHGMGSNHIIYDFDENHSLARYLQSKGWDVWLLDLRTHDGDGDFLFAPWSDREYINRYWDFDNTLLRIDVVTAVDFVKSQTGWDKIFLSGHSYGGYLAYAYAMLVGEENLSGIITTSASPYANPEVFQQLFRSEMTEYGYYDGEYAYVRPDGKTAAYPASLLGCIFYALTWKFFDHSLLFYNQITPLYIQRKCLFLADAEPAGVYVDMMFGREPNKYDGCWVDPQTLYNYSKNLDKISVPILFIAGGEDPQDPASDIYQAYQSVGSIDKTFYSFPDHSHMDILLGDDANDLIFPVIANWLKERGS